MKRPKPSGNCYENALKYAVDLITSGVDPSVLSICHGMCVGTGGEASGWTYGHAWLERSDLAGGIVIDVTLDHTKPKVFKKEPFYRIGRVHHVVRYPVELAGYLATTIGHCGPWDLTMPKDHRTTPEELLTLDRPERR